MIVARPVVTEQMSPDWRALRNAPGTERIRLEGLAPADALALARHRLDVDSLPPEVAEQIVTIAEGHPFFTEQLVLAMRDKDRVIRIESGECHVAATFSTARFAETVQALVDSRIDGLSLQQQDTLKVAAVLGRRFDVASFRNVHPGKPETDDLQKQLDTLTDLELLRVTDGPSGRTYSFKHSITQEAVSGWLLPSERRNLNFRVAQMIEDQHPADLTPVHALLAHHWREAGVISKALDYLELAALRALQEDANLEAIQFMQQALEYERTAGGVESSIATRLATWKQHLAEATWVMGDTQRAKHYVADALAQLHRAPRRPAIELAIQLLQRLAQAVLPAALFVERDDTRRQRLVQTSRIAAISAVLNTDPLDHVGALANGLLSYNLGARAGTTDVYALSMVAYAAGMLKLGPVARSYFARMRREAQAQNELRPLLFGLLLESMHRFSNGEIKASLKCLTDGLDLAGSGGNQRDRARLLILLGATMCFSDWMEPGLRAVREAYELARYERMAALERSWSLITLGGAYAQHSPTDELAEKYGSLREKIRESLTRDSQSEGLEGSRVRIATAVALDALVYSRLDRLDEALAAACEALDFLRSFRNLLPVHPTTWLLVQGPFEALWRAWERARTDPEAARRIAPHAQSFARVLARFSVLHPVYKPRALLFRGLVELRTGHAARAKSTWTRASAVAESLTAAQHDEDDACFMFDRALTLMALGGGALNGTIDRPAMVRALALLSCCGIPFFERRVQACLDGEAEGCELI